jgi:hypothetical protein
MDRDIALPLYGSAYILRILIPREIQFHFHNANRLENVSFVVARRLIRAIKEPRPEFAGQKNAERPLHSSDSAKLVCLDAGHGGPRGKKIR